MVKQRGAEISPQDIILVEKIGDGSFGSVWKVQSAQYRPGTYSGFIKGKMLSNGCGCKDTTQAKAKSATIRES